MAEVKVPPAPKGAGTEGRRLWRSVLEQYELETHELALLVRAVRVADVCTDLQGIVDAEGPLLTTRLGEQKAHPALVELRQQSTLLARLIVALRVPLGDEEAHSGARTQRRGIRGVYGIAGSAS